MVRGLLAVAGWPVLLGQDQFALTGDLQAIGFAAMQDVDTILLPEELLAADEYGFSIVVAGSIVQGLRHLVYITVEWRHWCICK